jgi:pimeloyl-ACP methyl ester carboxylesterase
MITKGQVEINGIHLSYLKSGKGKDFILFIHGSGMTSENWLPQLQDARLTSHYTLVAIDLPGHGESSRSSADATVYHPKKLALLVEPLLDHLHAERFLLVGLSLGTTIIAEIKPPIRGCVGIMLASAFLLNDHITPADILTPGPYGHVMAATNATDEDIRAFVYSHMSNEPIAERYILDYKTTDPAFREKLGKMMTDGTWTNEIANVQSWRLPLCIVMGEDDSLMKVNYMDSFSPLWNDKVYFIRNAGHFLNAEQPIQFNELLFSYAGQQFK